MKNIPGILLLILFIVLIFSCEQPEGENNSIPNIIPKPQHMDVGNGSFELKSDIGFAAPPEFDVASDFLKELLLKVKGVGLTKVSEATAEIVIVATDSLPSEGYELVVSDKKIILKARDASGAFYGIQSLRQLLPTAIERTDSKLNQPVKIPVVTIKDFPRFGYRGMHLDVARHFFPKEFIKDYISYLAMLKMNYFHWHLTDDQGWRIEIKKYPKLMSEAAYRQETLIGHYNDSPQQFDGQRYGGFYTQEDIREIVEFAANHKVTIIPEIEMPGHAQAAISAYPELGCTAKQVPVATKWGVFEDVFCPKEQTFEFLEDVLAEVIELFPGDYIHIGGDEAPKTHWKTCSACQQKIIDEGLKDEHELQSYFIKRIEAFVNSKGKKIIGWDEILEGGLAPNATVMSWRGIQGGIEAAKAKHAVIMTPTSYAYFDYYQSEDSAEPLAIGGYLPLRKVYGFNPVPDELDKDEAKFILGAQGNVWTEYMETEQQVEYMIFPRILAMSELTWNGPAENMQNDYPDFVNRVEHFYKRLDKLEVKYANHLYTISGKVIKRNDSVFYELSTPTSGKTIKYLLPDEKLTTYVGPFNIGGLRTQIKAMVYKDGEQVGDTFVQDIRFHMGMHAKLSLNVPPHKSYSAGGIDALNNGVSGNDSRYGDNEWLGFWGDDLEVLIDLYERKEINWLSTRFYHAPGQWIYSPKQLKLYTSDDGRNFRLDQIISLEDEANLVNAIFDLKSLETRFIKLEIPNYGVIPAGMQGAGNSAWTFIDEIIIQ
jgi:hexosaminidase